MLATAGSPITYAIDGEQYVAVQVGGSKHRYNDGRMLAFKLGDTSALPESSAPEVGIPEPSPLTARGAEIR